MANKLGNNLNRLIKERAYLGGALPLLQQEAAALKAKSKAKSKEFNTAKARLAELDKLIAESSTIDPDDIRRIKAKPRKMFAGGHGKLTNELVRLLQSYTEPVESGVILNHIVKLYAYPMDTPAQRRMARNTILGPLNLFKKYGAVMRYPSLDGSQQGRWQWVKQDADNEA